MEHGEVTRAGLMMVMRYSGQTCQLFMSKCHNWTSHCWPQHHSRGHNCLGFLQSHGGSGHPWYLDHPHQRLMIPELLCATHGHHVIFHQTFLNWTQEFHHQGSDHSSNWEDGIFYKCLASPCLCFPAPALLRLHVSCPRSPAGLVATASSVSNVPETKQSSLTESVMSDRLRPGHNKMMGGGQCDQCICWHSTPSYSQLL